MHRGYVHGIKAGQVQQLAYDGHSIPHDAPQRFRQYMATRREIYAPRCIGVLRSPLSQSETQSRGCDTNYGGSPEIYGGFGCRRFSVIAAGCWSVIAARWSPIQHCRYMHSSVIDALCRGPVSMHDVHWTDGLGVIHNSALVPRPIDLTEPGLGFCSARYRAAPRIVASDRVAGWQNSNTDWLVLGCMMRRWIHAGCMHVPIHVGCMHDGTPQR